MGMVQKGREPTPSSCFLSTLNALCSETATSAMDKSTSAVNFRLWVSVRMSSVVHCAASLA